MPIRYLVIPDTTGPVTHATTGALTGPAASLAGTSAHKAKHGTTGALTGAASAVAGSATNFTAHATTGALSGVASTVAGSAARVGAAITHATSGVLSGANAIVVGSAARSGASVTHATSGVLTGAGSATVGTALGTSLSQRDIAYLLWYMEANLAIPTAAQIATAVNAELADDFAAIPAATLAAAQTTPIQADIRKVANTAITGTGTANNPWGP